MRPYVRCLILWSLVLIAGALLLSVGQWLTAPDGYGASAWVQLMSDFGHRRTAATLRVARDIAQTSFISNIINSSINEPRDRLLRSVGYLNVDSARSLYATPHRMFSDDWRAISMFALGTVVVYWPLALLLALVHSRPDKRTASESE